VPPDVTAIAPRRGNDDARSDGDLVDVGLDGNFGGLAGVGQPNLDLLPADHNGPAYRHFSDYRQRGRAEGAATPKWCGLRAAEAELRQGPGRRRCGPGRRRR
jgi:hypothetical protein